MHFKCLQAIQCDPYKFFGFTLNQSHGAEFVGYSICQENELEIH